MKPEEMRDDIPMDVREALANSLTHTTQCQAEQELVATIRAKPRTVRIDCEIPAPLEAVPENGCVWTVRPKRGEVYLTEMLACSAVEQGFAWRTEEEALAALEGFRSWRAPRPSGDWTPHTPGDPMPCDGEAVVAIKMRDGTRAEPSLAHEFDWRDDDDPGDIIAWRYAREGEA